MNRRKFISLAASGAVANSTLTSVLNAEPKPLAKKSDRPNFLFMIADDLMYRTINSMNNKEIHTPNFDRLVARGCAFTHAFQQGAWTGAVCIPSRHMLNTGLNAFHAEEGVDKVHTWGQTMGHAGYDTWICGKWHLDPTVLQRSFKEMGPVAPGGLYTGDHYYNDQPHDSDHLIKNNLKTDPAYFRPRPGDTWDPSDKIIGGHWLHVNVFDIERPDEIEHSSSLHADSAIRHLEKAAKNNNPFFMYIGFNAPHDPRQSPKEILDLYPQNKIEVPPNFLPEHPFNIGPDTHGRDESLAPFPRTPEAIQLHRREYYAIITHMDQQIGRILDALEKSGKGSNTYVILTADHGLACGEHGLMGKQNLYDCSLRMPLLISGPGIERGRKVDELVYQHNMYATVCELADIPVPEHVQFPSIAPMLHGEPKPLYDAIFSYHRIFQRCVRTKTHKLIVYPHAQRMQLFDIANDPWEMHDLSDDPSMTSLKLELMGQLKALQKELGDYMDLKDPINGDWPTPPKKANGNIDEVG